MSSDTLSTRRPRTMINDDELFAIPFKYIVYVCAGLPMSALFICVSLATLIHFDGATRTHCGVSNWLPSISAAIGDYTPERYIWRMLIGLHSAPRFGIAFAYKNLFLNCPLRPLASQQSMWYQIVCYVTCALHVAENLFLLMLSCISSTEDRIMHQVCFIFFAIFTQMYMILHTWLFHYSGRRRTSTLGEKSYQYKVFTFGISMSAILMSLYFFQRHNAYCEPGIYTLFAICEYTVVIFNILFHSTLYYDFYGKKLVLASAVGFQYEPLLPSQNVKAT